ncbi:MAG: hypothetical protein RL885_07630 [Planctomycetota bacterium]
MRIALITCRVIPEPDLDESLTLDALNAAGVRAELVPWDDPSIDLSPYDLAILRSCWNYPESPGAFREWLERAEGQCRLMNPADIVRWNLDKRYLLELEARGIPIVPTKLLESGSEAAPLSEVLPGAGWSDIVIKPAVSAGSFCTRRFRDGEREDAEAFLRETLLHRSMLIQPTLSSFEDPGERAVIWIAGVATHAIRKSVRYSGQEEKVSEALPVTDTERRLVDRILEDFRDRLLYARVDTVVDASGDLLVSEVELIEPSLYFLQSPSALERFVNAVLEDSAARSS